MGLKLPDVEIEAQENELISSVPLELHLDEKIHFEAEIFLARGTSMDAILADLSRKGLPDPGAPRWPLEKALDIIAETYNERLFETGEGFGVYQESLVRNPPIRLFEAGMLKSMGDGSGKSLLEKIAWCDSQSSCRFQSGGRAKSGAMACLAAGGWRLLFRSGRPPLYKGRLCGCPALS